MASLQIWKQYSYTIFLASSVVKLFDYEYFSIESRKSIWQLTLVLPSITIQGNEYGKFQT